MSIENENMANATQWFANLTPPIVAGRSGSRFSGRFGYVLLGGRPAFHGAAACIDGGFLHIDNVENVIVLSTLMPKRVCLFTILVFG